MSNKTFIIAFVISLFFHFWIISIPFSFNMTENYSGKKQPVISIRMTFFTPDSFFPPAGEKIKPPSSEDKQISEKPIKEDVVVSQKKEWVTEVKEEKDKKIDMPGRVIENRIEQTQTSKKEKIVEIREKMVQEKENIFLSQKEDVQKDLSTIEIDSLPSSDSIEYQRKENNLSKQIETPLDLTQSDFSGKQIVFPKIVSSQQPNYPDHLRRRKIEGNLRLKVLINKEGKAVQVEIDHSSGYESFDQAAIESVYLWEFKPAQSGNKKRDSWILIPVRFQLK